MAGSDPHVTTLARRPLGASDDTAKGAAVVDGADAGAPGIAAPQALVTSVKRSAAATPYRFRDLLALDDFARHAKRHLPPMVYQYVAGAVETGTALSRSRGAFNDYALLPRALVDTSARTGAITLFGQSYDAPFRHRAAGGLRLRRLSRRPRAGGGGAPGQHPHVPERLLAHQAGGRTRPNPDAWFQGYLPGDQHRINRLLDRVEAAGYRTLVVTADTPVLGNREHNTRSGFSMPIKVTPKVAWQSATHPAWLLGVVARTFWRHGAPHFENMEAERGPPMMSRNALRNTTARDKLSWRDLEAIRRRWPGPLLVKGLLNPADVALAREHGADGVIVSTHGGRQLDHAVAPLDVLPEIAAAKGTMTVILDSGIRRGTDVLKALALGADFVMLGRPFIFAAAIGGVPGVAHAIQLLKEEINRDMALAGLTRLDAITPDLVRRVRGGGQPG